ncbi:MAG: hypothetical protein HKN11_06470 [Rhizobiales bacterium]|nr:hypothetical protein [Hyphomicrobiales bacterium]
MSMDPITETIAHFIGLFNLQTEASRLRADYHRFKATEAAERADEELSHIPHGAKAPHLLGDFDPKVHYKAEADPLLPPPIQPHLELPEIPPPPLENSPLYRENAPHSQGAVGGVGATGNGQQLTIEPPHSLAALIKQHIFLSDDDYLNMTDMQIETLDPELALIALAKLTEKAAELDRLNHDVDLSSEDGIGDFIRQTRDSLQAIAEYQNEDADIFVEHADAIDGTFVNGEAVAEAINLLDHLPAPFLPLDEEDTEEAPQSFDYGGKDGSVGKVDIEPIHNQASGAVALAEPLDMDGKVVVTAGANLMVNEVSLASTSFVSPVVAVMGDSVQLDVISQINAWHTEDQVDDELSAWDTGDDETEAYNVAAFTGESTTPEPGASDPEEVSIFPSTWAVTSVVGNVVFMNWIEQYALVSDNDTAVMSTSGSATISMLGGNNALNGVSLLELGNYYDVIIIDGDFLQANVISQMNVLLDSDKLWSPPGLTGESNGKGNGPGKDKDNGNGNGNGNVDSDGNLLWNQAAIHTIGKKQFEELTEEMQLALEQLAAGGSSLSPELLESELFAGLEGLRVLHISGDLLDLQYVRQTNVLGDADQIALVQEGILAASDSEWDISTGDNALVNLATIVDSGVDSTVMVAGEQYSDALLYQANLISDEPAIAAGDPLALANEAVAFLADDVTANPDNPDEEPLVLDPETSSADVMETMLA